MRLPSSMPHPRDGRPLSKSSPVDGTDKDQSVLNHALQVAQHFGSHIDVLHVRFDFHGASTDR